jgi:DTW domain-containing protein YfiP
MPCLKCGLTFQCICHKIPILDSKLHLSLLTHENEFNRDTNTGRWLLEALPECQRYQWQRNRQDLALISRLSQPDQLSFLLYPSPDSIPLQHALLECGPQRSPHFILLDATWQEARKMERKSPWLDDVIRVSFSPSQPSSYQLRKNQKSDHLCTLEVVVELLKNLGEVDNSKQLDHFFHFMMKSYLADKSGHPLSFDNTN